METVLPIDDLENLSATGAMLEGVLRQWVQDITECSPPDIVTFAEAIDFFSRLTAIRKTLIKLSRLPKPRPVRSTGSTASTRSHAPALPSSPVDLPTPNIDQIPCIPDVPYDEIAPQLNAISAALQVVCPTPPNGGLPIPDYGMSPKESDPSDLSLSQFSQSSHTSHASHASYDSHDTISNPQSEFHDPARHRPG